MQIEVRQVTSWDRVRESALWTVGKDFSPIPNEEWKHKMMMCAHSPKRLLEFDIMIKGIPYCNATHFVRHHIGIEKFQCSLRDDRNKDIEDRKKLPQDHPVNLWLHCNAEALINISTMRLCYCADETTRQIWRRVVAKINKLEPALGKCLVPQCIYRGFCPELRSCGRISGWGKWLQKYREGFKQ